MQHRWLTGDDVDLTLHLRQQGWLIAAEHHRREDISVLTEQFEQLRTQTNRCAPRPILAVHRLAGRGEILSQPRRHSGIKRR